MDLMVVTTTTMHSVTGINNMITCLAPYIRESSEIMNQSTNYYLGEYCEEKGNIIKLSSGYTTFIIGFKNKITQVKSNLFKQEPK